MKKNKIYIFTAALTFILLFTTSVICNLSALKPEDLISTISESMESKSVEIEYAESESVEETVVEEETTAKEIKEAEEEGGTATMPTVDIERIYGPVMEGDICVQRFKANVGGSPKPTIEWNHDDSNGAFGEDVAQVNLKAGEEFDLNVIVTNSAGSASMAMLVKYECDSGGVQTLSGDYFVDVYPVDLFIGNQPEGSLWVKIGSNGPGILDNNKVLITISTIESTGQSSGSYVATKECLMNLKPGETKDINLEYNIDRSQHSYEITVIIESIDFEDFNSNNNTYYKPFGLSAPGSGWIEEPNQGLATLEIQNYSGIDITCISVSDLERGVSDIVYGSRVGYGNPNEILKFNDIVYIQLKPGTYDIVAGYLENCGNHYEPREFDCVENVKLLDKYVWQLTPVIILKAPSDKNIWGFYYQPGNTYATGDWGENILPGPIPPGESRKINFKCGTFHLLVTTKIFWLYHWEETLWWYDWVEVYGKIYLSEYSVPPTNPPNR